MNKKKTTLITPQRSQDIYELLKESNLSVSNIDKIKKNESFCLEIINEALTHTSTKSFINHERLEFHGDAVLRLAASEYIHANFPKLKVGDRSALRSQLVSDEWLAKVGKTIRIQEFMLIAPKALKDTAATDTICAEGTEALIGAIYECLKDIDPIKDWLAPHWNIQSKRVLSDPHKQNAKSALQEWSQGKKLNKPIYNTQEISNHHGDSQRFHCTVFIQDNQIAEGSGSSIKNAEKEAARKALKSLNLKADQVHLKE